MREKYHDGRHSHPLFHTWSGMMRRCHDRTKADYDFYGGRGITVCERWHDFWTFVKDMGEKPKANYSIDRKDNSKGYSPENCHWISHQQQCLNRRSNKQLSWAGEQMTMKELAIMLEIPYTTLRSRVRRTGDIYNTQRDRKLERKVDAITLGICAIETAKQCKKDIE